MLVSCPTRYFMTRLDWRGSPGPETRFETAHQAFLTHRRRLMLDTRNHALAFSIFLLVLAFVCFPLAGFAQSPVDDVHVKPRVEPPDPRAKETEIVDPSLKTHTRPMKVDVDLVLVPVTITDPMNRLVTGLEQDNFEVFEGTERQQIKHFSSEDVPISLGVIFDTSGSMSNKIEKAREAVVEFFRTANPQDEFFMVSFNDRPEMVADFTSSVEDVQAKMV